MSDLYLYSVVRFVPHPVRDEAINVGIVMSAESGQHVHHRFAKAFRKKIAAIAPDLDPRAAERALADFRLRFPEDFGQPAIDTLPEALTKDRLEELSGQFGFQMQFTPPRPVLVVEASQTLDQLYREFVGGLPAPAPAPGRAKVRNILMEGLRAWGVPRERIVDRPQIPVRHGANSLDVGIMRTLKSELAVAVEPLSFSVKRPEEVIKQRDHVAWVASDADQSAGIIRICAVMGEPSARHEEIYRESLELFSDVGVEAIPTDELDGLQRVLERSGAGPSHS